MEKAEFRAFLKESILEVFKSSEIQDLLNKTDDNISGERYSTIETAGKHFKVTRQTIYNWIKRGIVRKYKIQGRSLVYINEIEAKMNLNPSLFGS